MSASARAIDWGERLPTLESHRLVLRMLEPRDVDNLFAIFGDPEAMRYWSSPPLRDRSAAAALLEEIHDCFRERSLFQWGVALREDDSLLGTCTIHRLDLVHARCEIGFAIRRSHWGRGYGREAVARLIRFAFDELGLHRIEADADPRNASSLRLLASLGFEPEGTLRQRYHVSGEWQDAVVLGLLRPESP